MSRVELPLGLEGSDGIPRTRRSLTNCFNNLEGQILPRPGITQLNTTNSVARGQFVWNDSLYQVVSQSLIKIIDTTTGTFSIIGTIVGNAVIDTAIGFNTAVILVKGGAIYTLDKADTLTIISNNTNFVVCDAVAHVDGRFVYIPTSGDPAFFSDVGVAGTVDVLSFFDAEVLPDKNSTVFVFKGTLYIGGTDSIELFRNTGASPNPFSRITGGLITNGVIGGLLEYNETFLFIGREKDQSFGLYAIGPGVAIKISNQTIDIILATYTPTQLAAAVSARFKTDGYDIATFTLANDSFGFYRDQWFHLETVTTGGASGPWGGGFINQFEGVYYTAFSDKIGTLEKVNTDYGEPLIKVIDTGFTQVDNDWFTCQSIELDVNQGVNDTDSSVGLFMSRNNVEYSDGYFRNLGSIGDYSDHLEWNVPGGLGMYNGFMGVRFQTSKNVSFSTNSLIMNFR